MAFDRWLCLCFALLLAICSVCGQEAETTSETSDAAFTGSSDDIERAALFNQWIADNYKGTLYLEVKPTPTMRFGAFATQDISAGKVYSSIPNSLLMGKAAIRKAGKEPYFKPGTNEALLLFLLSEVAKGNTSFWYPYLNILPTEEDFQTIPSYWPEEELKEVLNGTACYQKVMDAKQEEADEYQRLLKFIKSSEPELEPLFTFEKFKWARTVRDSRTIWVDGFDRQFVPLLDMVNCKHHRERSKVHKTIYGPDKSADTLALWNFKTGKQVFENYGQTNLMYYQYHGFTILNNVYDCYTLQVSHLKEVVEKWAKRNGRRISTYEFCLTTDSEVPTDALLIFAAAAAVRKGRDKVRDADAHKGLEKFLKNAMTYIPGDAATDKAIVKAPETSKKLKAAVQYRMRERQLIQKVIDNMKAQRYKPRMIPRRDEL